MIYKIPDALAKSECDVVTGTLVRMSNAREHTILYVLQRKLTFGDM